MKRPVNKIENFAHQKGAAIVVLLVVFILGTAYLLVDRMNVMSDSLQQRQMTQHSLNEIRDALLGYVVVNGSLPCPDNDNPPNGRADTPCTDREGVVPWLDLGVPYRDAWGRYIRYRADDNYSVGPTDTVVDDAISVSSIAAIPLTTDPIAAIIYSCGDDGIPNNVNDKNGVDNASATCIDTGTGDTLSYAQDAKQTGFDDILIWLSNPLLQTRLTQSVTPPP